MPTKSAQEGEKRKSRGIVPSLTRPKVTKLKIAKFKIARIKITKLKIARLAAFYA
jgi:hypothetical protein